MIMDQMTRSFFVDPYRQPGKNPAIDPDSIAIGGRDHFLRNTLPAPPWVPAIVDGLAAMMPRSEWGVIRVALDWCAQGEPTHRAEHLLTWLKLTPGPKDATQVDAFVALATAARAGRSKTATRERHVQAVRIDTSWEAQDKRVEDAKNLARLIDDFKQKKHDRNGIAHSAIALAEQTLLLAGEWRP